MGRSDVASLLAELEQERAAAQDDGQFSAAVQAIAGKARLAGLDRENGNGSEFSRCESVSDIMSVLLADQSVSEVLGSLATLSAQVKALRHRSAVTKTLRRPRVDGTFRHLPARSTR